MSLVDCLEKFVNNETNSDVTFYFPNTNVKYFAHKVILCARSDVFSSMFYLDDIKESTTNVNSIEVIDINPKNFLDLLFFIYIDVISLTIWNIRQISYASEKYRIEALASISAKFLNEHRQCLLVLPAMFHLQDCRN